MATTVHTSEPQTRRAPAEEPPADPGRARRAVSFLLGAGSHGFLVCWALIVTVPLLWAVSSALKTDDQIFSSPWSLPLHPQFGNFARAWSQASIGRYFLNSLIVVGGATALVMLLGSMTAYILACYPFKGSRVLYYVFVAGTTFPIVLALVPLFFVVKSLGLLNSYQGLILVYTAYALPFTVFFLTGFFRALPWSVAEAAVVDGCGHFRVYYKVMMPMARAGLTSIGIFNFLGLWNQYLLPLTLNQKPSNYVLAQGLAALSVTQGYRADWSALFAGLVIAMLPVLLVYLVFHRRIQSGLTAGAVK